jgi:hypothetical protein
MQNRVSFAELKARWNWRPIRNCPGRYVLTGVEVRLSPAELLGSEVQLAEFTVARARDVVVVARLKDGGLISYKRADGTYLHTLNTVAGLERKLTQLGVEI